MNFNLEEKLLARNMELILAGILFIAKISEKTFKYLMRLAIV